jgi:hypothetical protein
LACGSTRRCIVTLTQDKVLILLLRKFAQRKMAALSSLTARAVDPALLRLLFACALSAPSKSDVLQAGIVHVADRAKVQTHYGSPR